MHKHVVTIGKPKTTRNRPEVCVGDKWNFLTILETAGTNKFGQKLVKCRCECGKEKLCNRSSIKAGTTVSCGCYPRQMRKGATLGYRRKSKYTPTEAALRSLFTSYQSKARQYKRSFRLSFDRFVALVSAPCAYCGCAPKREFTRPGGTHRVSVKCNGIDRVDSTLGYEEDNTVTACWTCNTAKNSMSLSEFKSWISLVFTNLSKTEAVVASSDEIRSQQ